VQYLHDLGPLNGGPFFFRDCFPLSAGLGPKGEPGLAAAQIVRWKVDRERYRAVPFYACGKPGPAIELRDLFEQFLNKVERAS
jgi:hypothetical protein